jgi:hypothetical protein
MILPGTSPFIRLRRVQVTAMPEIDRVEDVFTTPDEATSATPTYLAGFVGSSCHGSKSS